MAVSSLLPSLGSRDDDGGNCECDADDDAPVEPGATTGGVNGGGVAAGGVVVGGAILAP